MKKTLLIFLAISAIASVGSCARWNTREYFEKATAEQVKEHLASGEDPNARDEYGSTPLHFAISFSQNPKEVVALLLKAGADPKVQNNEGETVWDHIQRNKALKNTDIYLQLKAL